jgi:predicted O-methyltransferase YrrM
MPQGGAMKFEAIRSQLEGIPFTVPSRAKHLYNFILENRPTECLELGFAHGVTSCYMAAALEEPGRGHLTSVDLLSDRNRRTPSIEELLGKTGLCNYVTIVREHTSYNWFLKKTIEEQTAGNGCSPFYDFCFIDGAKNWTVDGFAFYLVDKLLKPRGWILFDDYDWTYEATGRACTDGINHEELGEDERTSPHIELIVRLLVMQHSDYSQIRIQDEVWAWVQKLPSERRMLTFEETYTFKALLKRVMRGVIRRLKLGDFQGV